MGHVNLRRMGAIHHGTSVTVTKQAGTQTRRWSPLKPAPFLGYNQERRHQYLVCLKLGELAMDTQNQNGKLLESPVNVDPMLINPCLLIWGCSPPNVMNPTKPRDVRNLSSFGPLIKAEGFWGCHFLGMVYWVSKTL